MNEKRNRINLLGVESLDFQDLPHHAGGPRMETRLLFVDRGGGNLGGDARMATATGVRLVVRGDGRTYQFRLRQDDRFDGIAWRAEFTTNSDWQTVVLPFNEFIPVFRGRRVPDAGPVEPAAIRQVGFMLADKTPGSFSLEIRSIEF